MTQFKNLDVKCYLCWSLFCLKLVKHLTQSGTEKETAFIRCKSQEPLTSAGLGGFFMNLASHVL